MLSGGKEIEFVDHVPEFMEPIGVVVDISKLKDALDKIFTAVGFKESDTFNYPSSQICFNLNHPEKIPKGVVNIHYGGLATHDEKLQEFGLTYKDFSVLDKLAVGTYVEEVISTVTDWHNQNKSHEGNINRVHCSLLGNGSGYRLHADQHTTIRYHIALSTTDLCYMMCVSDNKVKATNIPVDGRVWLLDTRVLHTAINLSPNRYADKIRNHLIFSVSK
jgi:hypothetical protein